MNGKVIVGALIAALLAGVGVVAVGLYKGQKNMNPAVIAVAAVGIGAVIRKKRKN